MKSLPILIAISAVLAASALAGKSRPTILTQMPDGAVDEISAVLVEDVQTGSDSRGEIGATASTITVYTGPIIAPFTTYVKIFDLIPQDGGDYGSFKVFKIPYLMNDMPKQLKVQLAKDAKSVYVGFNANYFADFDENGGAKYAKGRMIAKFSVAQPAIEGAIYKEAELTIRTK